MRHTHDGSHAAALAARRYSSLQVLDEGWTAKQVRAEQAVQGRFYPSRDHPHASLVHAAISISCGAVVVLPNADGLSRGLCGTLSATGLPDGHSSAVRTSPHRCDPSAAARDL